MTDDALIRQVCDAATVPVDVMTTSSRGVSKLNGVGRGPISLGPASLIGPISAVRQEADALL
ncbi:hypothetical protein [Agrobacterium tumefaciens]|uniref:hypothetical protein n=1 Tax=Agrobacterium tumefaciens TaxID=358 RepID=UPI000980A54C